MYVEKLTITFQGSKDQKSSERTSRRCAATKNALEKSHLLRTVRIRPCKHSLVVFSHSHRVAATCRIFQHRARQGRRQICRSSPHGTSSFRCKSAPPGARISFKPVHGFICPPKYRRSYVADTRSCISSKSHCLIGWNNSRGAFCSLTRTPVRGRRHITDANSGRGKRAGKSMNYATSRAVTTVIYRQFDRGTRKICNIYIYTRAREPRKNLTIREERASPDPPSREHIPSSSRSCALWRTSSGMRDRHETAIHQFHVDLADYLRENSSAAFRGGRNFLDSFRKRNPRAKLARSLRGRGRAWCFCGIFVQVCSSIIYRSTTMTAVVDNRRARQWSRR